MTHLKIQNPRTGTTSALLRRHAGHTMTKNVRAVHQSTDFATSLAIVPARMTRLQQTLRTFQPVPRERFRVTGFAVFLFLNVILFSFPVHKATAQPPRSPAAFRIESESATASVTVSGKNNQDFLTGPAFEDALERIQSLAWQGQQLRAGLRQMSTSRQVAILLDRRIDPGQQHSLQVRNVSLRALLNLIATEADADVSILGNLIYIGPRESTARLRTVEEMLSSELVSNNNPTGGTGKLAAPPPRRSFELLQRRTLSWPDLATPQEILDEIARHYSLRIEGIELIPHDLWGEATIPSGTPTELLLAVLAQFDMSFEWANGFNEIRLVRMPTAPRIERRFTLKAGTEADIVAELKQRMPALERRVSGRRMTLAGTVEQLEAAEALIHPERAKNRPAGRNPGNGITTFTFAADAPLLAFMNTLEKQAGYRFEYDSEALKKSGIRLDKRIRLEANQLNATEVFHLMFDAQNIAFKVAGKTVQLTPAPRQD